MTDILIQLHKNLATTMMLFMGAVGIWGMFEFVRGGQLSGSISGALAIGQVLIALQVGAGVALYLTDIRPAQNVHLLYGITAIIIMPFAWSYARERHPRQALFFYALTSLFIAGLSVRGMSTGG